MKLIVHLADGSVEEHYINSPNSTALTYHGYRVHDGLLTVTHEDEQGDTVYPLTSVKKWETKR